jgi:hypothetical protein
VRTSQQYFLYDTYSKMIYGILIALLVGIVIGMLVSTDFSEGFQTTADSSGSMEGSPNLAEEDNLLLKTIPDACSRYNTITDNHLKWLDSVSSLNHENVDINILKQTLEEEKKAFNETIQKRRAELGCP